MISSAHALTIVFLHLTLYRKCNKLDNVRNMLCTSSALSQRPTLLSVSLCVVTKIKIFFTDFHWLKTNQVKRSFLVTFRLCVPFPLPLLKTAGHCNKSVDFLSLLKFFPRFLLPFVYKYAYS